MFSRVCTAAGSLFLLQAPSHAHLNIPPREQDQAVLLVGATIHPVSRTPISNGQMIFENGRITGIGKTVLRPVGTHQIDLTGKHVYPGLIAGNSALGLTEISGVPATSDLAEPGPNNPNVRAEVAVNPDSELFPVARANGVLIVHTAPKSDGKRGVIAGTSAVLRLEGWTTEDMVVKAPAGLHVYWPKNTERGSWGRPTAYNPSKSAKHPDRMVKILEETFDTARSYWNAKRSEYPELVTDVKWESMIPVLDRSIPVFVHADDSTQILEALHWAEKQEIDIVIVGGRDAWRVAEDLKEKDVPVIISPVLALPLRRWEPANVSMANPAKLLEAGVLFAIANTGTRFGAAIERNLPYQAAAAVAHGLPADEALRSITLNPARILGVEDRLGSLEIGKDATFFVTDGDPLDVRTNVEMAFVDGRRIDLSTRQTRLYEKYKQKYQQPAKRGSEGEE